jgi:hypothetical protein
MPGARSRRGHAPRDGAGKMDAIMKNALVAVVPFSLAILAGCGGSAE